MRTSPIALAAQMCLDTNAANYIFDGAGNQTTTYGTYANLDSQVGALCTTGNQASLSSAWAMTAGGSNSNGYAQSGIWSSRSNGDGLSDWDFSQWAKQNPAVVSGAPYYTNLPGTISGSHNYRENYEFTTGVLQMWIDNTELAQTNFDPITVWTAPWQNQWYGETHDPGDDMPGLSSSPEHFRYMQYLPCRSCAWQAPTGVTLSNGGSRYAESWVTTNYNMNIWTQYP